MKIVDRIFRFPKDWSKRRDSICRIRVFVHNGMVTAVLTDLGDLSTGGSVTNFVEDIRDAMVLEGTMPASTALFEHYERGDDFELLRVSFDADGNPSWHKISRTSALESLGCDEDELLEKTAENMRLRAEIERVTNEIDPFLRSPYPEPKEVVWRRMAIERSRVSKGELARLVEAGSGERELLRVLKSDLSLLGEFYVRDDEYIVFSEFPIGGGFVDFAIFAGRSRMDIILIEIKGADFGIVNIDSYGKFASKIEEATHQIRERLSAVHDDYQTFRKQAHRIRKAAEAGSKDYGALLGPRVPLEVDPNKDVTFRCVVIGGRTRNDIAESKKRNDYEDNFHPAIKIESWDSWLRKLDRR